MFWTLFKVLFVVWMLQMVLEFGANALRLIVVVSLVALALRLIIRRTSFNSDGFHCTAYNQLTGRLPQAITQRPKTHIETGRFNSSIAEPFAGASKINSSFHNKIFKEQHQ
jgi:hypothetical protein